MGKKENKIEALKMLTKKDEYFKELKKKNLERAKRTLASQDRDKDIQEKIELDEKIDELAARGKSDEDLEREAEERYKEERKKRGLLTKPLK